MRACMRAQARATRGTKSAEIAEIRMQIAAAMPWIETLFNYQPLKLIISDLLAFVSSLKLGEDGSGGGGGGGGNNKRSELIYCGHGI